MDYEELLELKVELGMTTEGFCGILGVTTHAFYKWKRTGIPKSTENLLRVMRFRPDVVINVLMLNEDEVMLKYSLWDLKLLEGADSFQCGPRALRSLPRRLVASSVPEPSEDS